MKYKKHLCRYLKQSKTIRKIKQKCRNCNFVISYLLNSKICCIIKKVIRYKKMNSEGVLFKINDIKMMLMKGILCIRVNMHANKFYKFLEVMFVCCVLRFI